ncbi:caspase family protein [Roseibium sp.]|uniref:caspase family protein n=1 Tax=Roseibium sp. TaxID=1936156 RepID=UPI003B5069F3
MFFRSGNALRSLCFFFIFLLFTIAAHAEKRVALVVGNGAYTWAGALENPVNDARKLGEALRNLDFEVHLEENLQRSGFQEAIRTFSSSLEGADVALFFYAGHGIQVAGENYLVPADANLQEESDINVELIAVKSLLKQMEGSAKTRIILLDACRNNPFTAGLARSMGTRSVEVGQGLARVDSGPGTLIAYATEPGNVALDGTDGNSPFTKALLNHISTPNLDVARMLRRVRTDVIETTEGAQIPWENSSLVVDFTFRPADRGPVELASSEQALWEAVRYGDNPDEVRLYLERYPNGQFAKAALELLNKTLGHRHPSISDNQDAKALQSRSSSVKACLTVENSDLGLGVPEGAEQACYDAVALFPNSALLRLLYGKVLDRAGNEPEAARQYRQSAELNNTNAMIELAVAYELGKGVEWQPEESLRLLNKSASRGNAEAMNHLAHLYTEGNLVDYDEIKAFQWFQKAAEAGNPEAAFYVAGAYDRGEGVDRNDDKARFWYQRALKSDDSGIAATNLAWMYLEGRGGDKDTERARQLLEQAAAADDVIAMRELARQYLNGTFKSAQKEIAVDWLMKALRSGGRIEAEYWFLTRSGDYPLSFNKAVQRRLKEAGTYQGKIDGKIGDRSLQALFQYADQ